MSRKRFIKLMMAAGYSRNFAAACALRVLEWGSYEVAYTKLRDFDPSLPYLSELIRRACRKLLWLLGVFTPMAKLAGGIRWDE